MAKKKWYDGMADLMKKMPGMASFQPTGAGTDGVVQPNRPAGMLMGPTGMAVKHEGEAVGTNGAIIPAKDMNFMMNRGINPRTEADQKKLQKIQKDYGIRGFATGLPASMAQYNPAFGGDPTAGGTVINPPSPVVAGNQTYNPAFNGGQSAVGGVLPGTVTASTPQRLPSEIGNVYTVTQPKPTVNTADAAVARGMAQYGPGSTAGGTVAGPSDISTNFIPSGVQAAIDSVVQQGKEGTLGIGANVPGGTVTPAPGASAVSGVDLNIGTMTPPSNNNLFAGARDRITSILGRTPTAQDITDILAMIPPNASEGEFYKALGQLSTLATNPEDSAILQNITNRAMQKFGAGSAAQMRTGAQMLASSPYMTEGAKNAFVASMFRDFNSAKATLAGDLAQKSMTMSLDALSKLGDLSLQGAQYEQGKFEYAYNAASNNLDRSLQAAIAAGNVDIAQANDISQNWYNGMNVRLQEKGLELQKAKAIDDFTLSSQDQDARNRLYEAQIAEINQGLVSTAKSKMASWVRLNHNRTDFINPDGSINYAAMIQDVDFIATTNDYFQLEFGRNFDPTNSADVTTVTGLIESMSMNDNEMLIQDWVQSPAIMSLNQQTLPNGQPNPQFNPTLYGQIVDKLVPAMTIMNQLGGLPKTNSLGGVSLWDGTEEILRLDGNGNIVPIEGTGDGTTTTTNTGGTTTRTTAGVTQTPQSPAGIGGLSLSVEAPSYQKYIERGGDLTEAEWIAADRPNGFLNSDIPPVDDEVKLENIFVSLENTNYDDGTISNTTPIQQIKTGALRIRDGAPSVEVYDPTKIPLSDLLTLANSSYASDYVVPYEPPINISGENYGFGGYSDTFAFINNTQGKIIKGKNGELYTLQSISPNSTNKTATYVNIKTGETTTIPFSVSSSREAERTAAVNGLNSLFGGTSQTVTRQTSAEMYADKNSWYYKLWNQ